LFDAEVLIELQPLTNLLLVQRAATNFAAVNFKAFT
jgi:hypothetical protein